MHLGLGAAACTDSQAAVIMPEFASYWAKELGTTAETLVQLRGGINNHVLRCGSLGGYWVIKGYPALQSTKRDRMQAEVEFLRYSHLVAPGRVPKLIAVDNDRRCVVLEHIAGEAYPEGKPPPIKDLQAGVEFFQRLNANLNLASEMIRLDAAEGFLSLREHMSNVRERLNAMSTDQLPAALRARAVRLLRQLDGKAEQVQIKLEAEINSCAVEDALDPENRCVSPSDFGFHNAIKTVEGVTFIDFEFAGWDDPAKAAADFLLQPRIPISRDCHPGLSDCFANEDPITIIRFKALLPILRLKWACIILSILKSERLGAILSVNQNESVESLIQRRLALAETFLTHQK